MFRDLRLISNQIDPSPKAVSGMFDSGKARHACCEEPLASWLPAHSIVAVQSPGVWVLFWEYWPRVGVCHPEPSSGWND